MTKMILAGLLGGSFGAICTSTYMYRDDIRKMDERQWEMKQQVQLVNQDGMVKAAMLKSEIDWLKLRTGIHSDMLKRMAEQQTVVVEPSERIPATNLPTKPKE